MQHPELKLFEYLNETLSGIAAKKVKVWIEASDANKKLFDQIRYIHENSLIEESDFTLDVEAAWNTVSDQTTHQPKQAHVIFSNIYKIAAAILLAIGLSYIGLVRYGEGQDYQSIATLNGQNITLTLADGTRVWLNENTEFEYPENFNDARRTVRLNGQAFFEVSRDENRPFRIEGEQSIVEVLGTSFDLISTAFSSKVNVVTGKVALYANKNAGSRLILIKGQQGSFQNNELKKEGELSVNAMTWRTGVFEFKSTPMADVAKALSTHFEVNIEIEEAIVDCLITSRFENKELEEILDVLYVIAKIKNTQSGEEIVLSGPGC